MTLHDVSSRPPIATSGTVTNSIVHIALNHKEIYALFDSGASISCINEMLFNELVLNDESLTLKLHNSDFTQIKGIAGQISNIIGLC